MDYYGSKCKNNAAVKTKANTNRREINKTMNYIILFFLVATLIIDLYIIFFFITRKDNHRSVYFVLLAIASFIYTAGELLLQMSATPEAAMNALKISNIGIPLLAPCFLLVSLSLFSPKSLKSWMLPAVGSYGLLMFLLILFNENHLLYYGDIILEDAGHFTIERNILYWVGNQTVALLCMIPAYIIMLRYFIKGNKKFRRQTIYILIGAFVVFAANVANFTNLISEEIDPTPFAMGIVLIFFAINTARYKILDITTVASGTAFKTMGDAMIILDVDWCFLYCNDSAKSLFPSLASLSQTESINKIQEWPRELESADKLSEIVFESANKDASNSTSTYRANINKIIDDRGDHLGWSIIIHDITSITFLITQLEDLATTDPLTGIVNRRSFLEKVKRELDMSIRLNISNALIMYDIDNFKKVNDTYGHAAGDYILCAVVEIVKKKLRFYDIFARYGGEEFLIFMPASNEDSLYVIADRLCKEIANGEIVYNKTKIPITASFGAVQVSPGSDFDEAMLAVDEAMYEAKHNGKNQVVVKTVKKSNGQNKQTDKIGERK